MTYNKYFNDAWEYLKELHPTINLQGEAIDMSVKPNVSKKEYCRYMDAIWHVITIGQREKFITTHVDGHGHAVYIKLLK